MRPWRWRELRRGHLRARIDPVLGVGVPANGPISPSSWAYDDTIKPVKRDLDMAKAKLAEAGMPNGFTFTFNTDNTPLSVQEVVQVTVLPWSHDLQAATH